MSILDALRVQKAEQKSVRDLAMLPQQLIIQLAQRGDIPAEVAPVVINEKARIAEEKERMMAMAQSQGMPSTVLEKAMATNARAENPQGIAQMAPQMAPQGAPQAPQGGIPGVVNTPETQAAGVTGLPTGQMFAPQNFAGGGIVAFAGEGRSDVDLGEIITQQQRQDPSFAGMFAPADSEDKATFRRRYTSLADALKDVRESTGEFRTESPEELAYMEYQKGQKPRSEAEMRQQGWMRALEAGLGIMGGTSPYGLTNIGKGSEAALRGYGEDVKEQRRREAGALQTAATLARQKRLEGIEDVKEARRLLEKDIEAEYRERALNRTTDYQRRYENYLPKVMKDLGIDDPTDPNVKAETARRVDLSIGAAGGKLEQRREEETGDRASSALTNTRNELKADNQYRILSAKALGGKTREEKAERQREADAYALKLLNKNRAAVQLPPLTSLPEGTAPSIAPSAPARPEGAAKGGPPDLSKVSGIPSGSKVGKQTTLGWEVFNSEGKLIGHIKE